MKNLSLLILCSFLFGCGSVQQTQLNQVCSDSKKAQNFPEPGSKAQIEVSFEILVDNEILSFSERAVCHYQGSFCPAGEWYEVWYGDQSIQYDIDLSQEERLTFWPHSFCIQLNEYKEDCVTEECRPEDFFKLRLHLSAKRESDRKRECEEASPDGVTNDPEEFVRCALPGVDLVTLSELENYGYEVRNEKIRVSNAGL